MSHYKPYPAYRDSGVEWIGEVPEHWEVKRLRHVASFKNSNVDKKAYEGQEAVSLCNYTDVYYNEFITPDLPFMQATASATEIEQFSLRKGDVIITKDSEDPSDIGIPSLVKDDVPGVICGYHLTMIRGADFDTSRLLHRILQSNPTQAHFFVEAPGITRYGLSQDAIGDLPFNYPPENERNGIANAVDRETARIDALITKKTRFIELLREKRQALITHAVTKGLDPDVKMKDSGVEWLGEVPAHWQIKPLWSVFKPIKRTGFVNEQLLSVYRDYGVIPKSSRDDNRNRASDDLSPYQLVEPDNLVTNKMKTWQGSIAVSEHRGIVSPAYFVYEAIEPLFGRFIHHLMRSSPYITGYMSISKGIRVGQWDLDQEHFRVFPILFPSLIEQKAIVKTLDSETARIDLVITKTQRSIDLLKERRAAFITAAVTGQIDLRESA